MSAADPADARGADDQLSTDGPVVAELLAQWDLRPDGAAWRGDTALLVPVRRRGVPPSAGRAVVKLSAGSRPGASAHVILRRWGGNGAVRLLAADPARNALLLERLDRDTTLAGVDLFAACEEIGRLLAELAVPALPQLPTLSGRLVATGRALAQAPAAVPRRFVEQAAALADGFTTEPDLDARVVHTELHDAHVLAGGRSPWTAIAPAVLSGDPAYGVAPVLWHRWDAAAQAHDVRNHLRFRIDAVCDPAGIDPERARAFALIRLVHRAVDLATGRLPGGDAALTATVTAAKAMQG